MVEFLDPRGQTSIEVDVYDLKLNVRKNEGSNVTVGLLANGFPDSELFMTKIAAVLEKRLPKIKTRLWNKGNAGIAASDEMLAEISGQCQVAIAAYGHWGSCTSGTVRDGINIAKLGIPSVALVTEDFWPQGDFVAASLGMPSVPRVQLPHPVAGSGETRMMEIAEQCIDQIVDCFAA